MLLIDLINALVVVYKILVELGNVNVPSADKITADVPDVSCHGAC